MCWHAGEGGLCPKSTKLYQLHIQNINSISKEILQHSLGLVQSY